MTKPKKPAAQTEAADKSAEASPADDTIDPQTDQDAESVDQNSMADDWAAAMAEQTEEETGEQEDAGNQDEAGPEPTSADDQVFKPLEQSAARRNNSARDLETVMDIPVKLNVELGRTRITIKELLELTEGSVVELDGLAGDPMDILINGYLVAQGEVVVVDDKYGIRVTEIMTASERIQKLNR